MCKYRRYAPGWTIQTHSHELNWGIRRTFNEGTGSSHEKFDAWPGPNINGMKMVTWFSSPSIVYDAFQQFLFISTFFIPQKAFSYLYVLPEVCQPYAWLQWPHQMNHGQSHLPECSSQVYLKITKIRLKKIKKEEFWQQIISRVNQSFLIYST